jgi:phosphonate metabolism protein PhnN/1,5-bisphosphokinase (PRPP-forming)
MTQTVVYVCGPSGSGKDSVIRYAQQRLTHDACFVFTQRYVTRGPDASSNHVAIDRQRFCALRDAGALALHWESHGCCYGLSIGEFAPANEGRVVIVNGSRAYLPEAQRRLPGLKTVLVTAPPAILKERLAARAREDARDIAARLQRNAGLDTIVADAVVNNAGDLRSAGEAFVALLLSFAAAQRVAPSVAEEAEALANASPVGAALS